MNLLKFYIMFPKRAKAPIDNKHNNSAPLIEPQQAPVHNNLPAVWDLVIEDMKARNADGTIKYGTPLQPFNGRDALVDAYQEALDLVVYLRQVLFERELQERMSQKEKRK